VQEFEFDGSEIKFPHSAEAFVVDRSSPGSILGETLAPMLHGVAIVQPQHFHVIAPQTAALYRIRRVIVANKSPETTPVANVMTRDVVTVDIDHAFADFLRLMHQHGIRHLPVVSNDKAVAVISIRDLLGEAVRHHERLISELERERLTIFASTA